MFLYTKIVILNFDVFFIKHTRFEVVTCNLTKRVHLNKFEFKINLKI